MNILISTQSYKEDIPTPYGYLLECDGQDGSIIRKKRIETPVETEVKGERLKPGLRGLFIYNEEIYTATWNKVLVLDKKNFSVKMILTHKWMSDLHGICVDEDGIWITSSLPDALILFDFSGNLISSLWFPETRFSKDTRQVDKNVDWRMRGKTFRGFYDFHCNNVTIKDGLVYVTGRTGGRIITFQKKEFINSPQLTDRSLTLFKEGLYGPHDGLWHDNLFWVTETLNSSIAAINPKGKVKLRKTITATEGEKVTYNNPIEYLKYNVIRKIRRKHGKRVTHWTRGMCIIDNSIYVGQSTWAGNTHSRARIIKLDKKSRKITDCLYLDIPDYPETRIYQLFPIDHTFLQ